MAKKRVYQIYAKVRNGAGSSTHKLEAPSNLKEAEKLAEEYATGKEAAFLQQDEQVGHPKISFYPLSAVEAVYVVPEEKEN